MKLHAFVAMPIGKKTGPYGTVIDFNAVYKDLIKPTIDAAGLEVFLADEELAAGDIKTDMFQQLRLQASLGFNPVTVHAGIDTFQRALTRLQKPERKWRPRKVFLFSVHMIDAPDRVPPRFLADKETIATEQIAQALDKLGANLDDLALTQDVNGSDILFAEACLQRGVKLKLKLKLLKPFEEPAFIQNLSSLAETPGGSAITKSNHKPRSKPPPPNWANRLKTLILTNAVTCVCSTVPWYTALKKCSLIYLWNGEGREGGV
jgi:hypothetical protein